MNTRHILRWVGAEAFIAAPIRPAPAILRFDGDDFMDRMLGLLEATPQRLPDLVAKYETWNGLGAPTPEPPPAIPTASRTARALKRSVALLGFRRAVQPPASPEPKSESTPTLKLFQPVHQRYYLAAAHLVCEQPGLPPRIASAGDRSGFVLRRLLKTTGGAVVEHGFVKENGTPGCWTPLAAPNSELAPNEEWLPVFPLNYAPPTGPRRPLLAGLIPVARHDEYRFARRTTTATPSPDPAAERIAELKALAQTKLVAPWQALVERAVQSMTTAQIKSGDNGKEIPAEIGNVRDACIALNDQLCEASWRLLQDFREFLHAHLPEVEKRLNQAAPTSPTSSDDKLLRALEDAVWPTGVQNGLEPSLSDGLKPLRPFSVSLRAALDAIGTAAGTVSTNLDNSVGHFPNLTDAWPTFAFPLVLADANTTALQLRLPLGAASNILLDDNAQNTADNAIAALFDTFIAPAVEAAVHAGQSGTATPQATSAARLANDLAQSLAADPGPPRYVLRFVHKRCDCGPLQPLVISAPSEVFELAGFFDSEAPLRPIRIALPFDTTPGGLRKFGKNSAFIMSDVLCGQMKRVRKFGFGRLVRAVLPWPFHKDLDVGDMAPCSDAGGNFGVICSLSIPIITLVAFILLIVIAVLLDLIFRWLPFLIACFPVPGLKGKR
ncbi:MAG: hypothetical protein U1F76_06900 [Candidatus Competibacteraceae bacterium]